MADRDFKPEGERWEKFVVAVYERLNEVVSDGSETEVEVEAFAEYMGQSLPLDLLALDQLKPYSLPRQCFGVGEARTCGEVGGKEPRDGYVFYGGAASSDRSEWPYLMNAISTVEC